MSRRKSSQGGFLAPPNHFGGIGNQSGSLVKGKKCLKLAEATSVSGNSFVDAHLPNFDRMSLHLVVLCTMCHPVLCGLHAFIHMESLIQWEHSLITKTLTLMHNLYTQLVAPSLPMSHFFLCRPLQQQI